MDYAEQIIKNYKDKLSHVQQNVATTGIFPDRTNPTRPLESGAEFLLKTTFRLRVCFLEEMTFLFAYIYSKSKFETLVIDLEQQGYLKSRVSKDYGKYFILTKEALYYIYTDRTVPFGEAAFSEDRFPKESNLGFYKCINGLFAKRVFHTLTSQLRASYDKNASDVKRYYQKSQYIMQYIYSKREKPSFSRTEAKRFVEGYIGTFESDQAEQKSYNRFIALMKEQKDNDLLQFSFLKDYYNANFGNRNEAVKRTEKEFSNYFNNIYRDRIYDYRQKLYAESDNSDKVKQEYELFALSEFIRILSITKRSLLNTKTDSKSGEQLKELTEKTDAITRRCSLYEKKKMELEEVFTVMLFSNYGANDVAVYKEAVNTLENLKNMNVFITKARALESGRIELTFSVFPDEGSKWGVSYLFPRLERIFQFYINNLLSFDYRIELVTYTDKQKDLITENLKTVREQFEDLSQYGLLLPRLDEAEVVTTQMHFKERYEVFRELM